MPEVLEVRLHGAAIGTLTRFAGDRTLFAFNESYIADRQRPTLGLHFKDAFGELIADLVPTHVRLHPWFSNLLPEGPLRAFLAGRAGVHPERAFFLLGVLGRDLPGAVTVAPADGDARPPADDDAGDAAATGHVGVDRRAADALRFSLAGVQLKFSAVAEAAGGLTIPAKGIGGSWIVKLPARDFPGVAENEFSMMSLARLLGMDVPAVRLVDPADIGNLPDGLGALPGQALAVERFDRRPSGEAVHVEDFAQVFGVWPDDKYRRASYRNIARVVGAEGTDADVAEFIRRLTFNALIGNADMHLKNWSLTYPDRRRAALAPAYDFVSTIAYIADPNAALNFSRTKRFDGFTADELAHLAAKALLPARFVLDTARQTVALFHQHWAAEKRNLPLAAAAVAAIDEHVRRVPMAG